MSAADPLAVLEVKQRNELEALLLDFDESWAPESFEETARRIASHPIQQYGDLALAELVKVDLQRSWSAGDGRMLEQYLQQFPSLGNIETVAADLVAAEFEARSNVDADLVLASYESRFPKQFPLVQQLVSELTESSVIVSPPKPTEPDSVQASIDTSRIDNLRDTKDGKKRDSALELPVEFGRYRILKELGSGAMGKVYLAHDSQLDRQVALKTPRFSGSADDDMVTRFYREARAAAKIHHRNICPIFDVGEIDGRHFITMAFIKGRCMSEFIKPDRLPPQRTSAILVQRLAAALAEAHKHNVIHRDLKPANIMIDLKKEPVVMDFGLAQQMDVESRVTQSGMAVGTPAYMSPEQIRGELDEVGTSADIYALGVILYELLTGQLPFRGPIAKVVYGIVNDAPKAPSTIRDDVEADLESICAKMMAKKREERYSSMEDLAIALKNYLKGKKRTVKPVAPKRQLSSSTTGESNVEQLTETAALNAFFAAQVSLDPTRTKVEPGISISPQSRPVVEQNTKTSSRRGGGRSMLVALGLGGFAVLAGVIIYFSDGSKIEIEDGTHAEVQVNPDGTLKSIKTSPQPANQSPTTDLVASTSRESDKAETDFVDLFNGRDLNGWRGVEGLWKWQDGELVGTALLNGKTLSYNTALCSIKKYQNFELMFEVKLEIDSSVRRDSKAPNSGIQFRSSIVDHTSFKVAGPQADIGGKYWGGLWGEGTTGMMHEVDARLIKSIVKEDEWNQYRLFVEGDRVSIKVNSVETVDRRFPNLPKDGVLGFQLHRGLAISARFRNIKIRELEQPQTSPRMPETTLAPAEKHERLQATAKQNSDLALDQLEPTDDRTVAEQIVGFGGSVQLAGSGKWIWTLPDGKIRVEGVSFFRKQKQFDDGHIALLGQLPDLQAVVFYPNKMSNKGFATLAEMENVVENVKKLSFHRAPLGRQGLAALANLKRLETLTLHHTDLINDDLVLLTNIPALRELSLEQETKKKFGPAFLTDDCLKHLRTVSGLRKLTLIGEPFTDKCLANAADLTIKELWLATPNITDQAISQLKEKRPRLGITRFKYDSNEND